MTRKASVLASVAIAIAVPAAAQPPPAEAYGRLPAIADAALSPDGRRLALSVSAEYRVNEKDRDLTAFRILNIDTGTTEHILAPPPKHRFRGVGWADEQRPYYFISTAVDQADMLPSSAPVWGRGSRIEFVRTGVFSLEKRATTILMDDAQYRRNNSLADLWVPVEGDPGFGRMIGVGGMATLANALPRLTVYRVNLDNGSAMLVDVGNALTRGYLLDERGAIVARVDVNDNDNRWQLFTYEDGKDRMILEDVSEMGQPLFLYGLLEDGRIAAVDPHESGARDTLLAIDRKTGAKTALHSTEGSDIAPVRDPWTKRAVGVFWTDDLPKQHFFDGRLQQVYTTLNETFADGYAYLASWSRDRGRILVFGERANDAGAYYVYEPAEKKLRSVGKTYPALSTPESLGDRRAIRFKARDGTSVPAYLTLPVGVEPKNLPLVLLVHGGPHARDTFAFDWWASFLVSRGYAVLQVNFRGSTGYGYEWFNAGRGRWGEGVIQTDVEDGADALVKNGMVDAARICIMGGSYGGYAALAGATLTPGRYACAASVNGVSDLERMRDAVERGQGKRGMLAEWWRTSMGGDIKQLRKVSPIENAERARAPILIVHGTNDSVVPVEHGRSMRDKLERADKNVRYVELSGDDHWLSSAETRTLMLREVETFLAENLARPGGATAPGAAAKTN
jgi:dipeptidyl aminopeptidase/acylaminoacyl peptidase